MNSDPGNISTENLSSEFSRGLEQDSLWLPGPLEKTYDVFSCLKYSDQTATYLLRKKSSGQTVLLKTASDPLFARSLINEKTILDMIHNQESTDTGTFPTPLELYKFRNVQYFIRSYIQGKTLEELCESNLKKPGLPKKQALSYMIQLTKQLHFLHTLSPPVIHRDIKPQNVIVDTVGICHFIDLGISRFFEKTIKPDIPVMGTQATAPPEQLFDQQTDTRSDLYSLGILFHYCLTGEYKISGETMTEVDPTSWKIIEKATQFDPNRRYQSANELLYDLISICTI